MKLRPRDTFAKKGITLRKDYGVQVGVSGRRDKKKKQFDLGSDDPPVLVECKSHTWTSSGNVPSAKIHVWNEAMYYFCLAPEEFQKILFVLRDFNKKRGQTLAQYYFRTHGHLIPDDVKILEYDERSKVAVEVGI